MPTRPVLATYRLQLRGGLDLEAAAGTLPYLAEFGVSHVYLSPVLRATDGSTHGYDVVDPSMVDPALGGDDAFRAFAAAADAAGLGVVVDIVPNHMAADPERNSWWRSVLRHGPASTYAFTFDITWDPPDRKLHDQILLPVLGDHYGRELDAGRFRLERLADDELVVRVYETTYPLEPRSAAELWQRAAGRDGGVDDVLAEVNAEVDQLHAVLEQQHYRLARWRTGSEEVDYRRFFDITSLVGVRVEQPDVFQRTHATIGRWIADGLVDGLRVDHPDGLADPEAYCRDLRRLAGPDTWIVVEKILEPGEALAPWVVDGTTGYDFATVVGGLFVEPAGYEQLQASYAEHTGGDPSFEHAVLQGKIDALHTELSAELRRLTDRFVALCEQQPRYRDFSRRELHDALLAAIASFPRYRSYVTRAGAVSPDDRKVVEDALTTARERHPGTDAELFRVLHGALTAEAPFATNEAAALRQRFQQLTGAVMAKGDEDTALYRYTALLAVNEVGGDPAHPARSVDDLHAHNTATAAGHPATMLTLATHDTKRSDDVRARLAVLSELPGTWTEIVRRWSDAHRSAWADVDPDPSMELLVFQTLVGAHPLPIDRAWPYVEKAAREAGLRTSWLQNDADYERALRRFVDALYDDQTFQVELEQFVTDEVRDDGWANALAQRLLLLTSPGVPDLYQGTELWSLQLVDPDNRQPVDFADRRERLRAQRPGTMPPLDGIGDVKLALTRRALAVRQQFDEDLGPGGSYVPRLATGPAAEHVVAFQRGEHVIAVAARLHRTRRDRHDGWAGTTLDLPDGRWDDQLAPARSHHGSTTIDEILADWPVALLVRRGAAG